MNNDYYVYIYLDSRKSGRYCYDNIIQIKLLLMEERLTQQEIADIFGVCRKTISDIKNRRSWSYINMENLS